MSPEQINELLRREPFIPFTIYLTDGNSFAITEPQMVAVMGRMLSIGQNRTHIESDLYDTPILVSILHITYIEPLIDRQLAATTQRKS